MKTDECIPNPASRHTKREVIVMGYPKYSGLAELLKHDEEALRFFEGLPAEVRERIAPKGKRVDSMEKLRDFAEALAGEE